MHCRYFVVVRREIDTCQRFYFLKNLGCNPQKKGKEDFDQKFSFSHDLIMTSFFLRQVEVKEIHFCKKIKVAKKLTSVYRLKSKAYLTLAASLT